LFHNDIFRHHWLAGLGWRTGDGVQSTPDAEYDRVADALEAAVGWPALEAFLFGTG
jgi:cobyric acid synthase